MAAPFLRMHARHHPHGALFSFQRRERNQSRVSARNAIRMDAGNPGVNTLFQGARSIYCGAHRLPAGMTAAEKRERGRRAGQAVKLFEDRLLLESKALAPFVKTGEF